MPSTAAATSKVVANAQAWRYHKAGVLPDVVQLDTDIPVEHPADKYVLVRVSYAALNPVDWKLAKLVPSALQKLPRTVGADFAGTIESVGAGVEGSQEWLKPGTKVYGIVGADDGVRSGRGTLTTHLIIEPKYIQPIPASMLAASAAGDGQEGEVLAAGLSLVGLTALKMCDEVKQGARVFINGGTTAVGLVLADMARWKGASFVVASASGEKVEVLKKRGLDDVIDYRATNLVDELKRRYGDKPFDAILDCVGTPELYLQSPPYLAKDGVYVNVGASMLLPTSSALSSQARSLLSWVTRAQLLPSWAGGVPRRFKNYALDRERMAELARSVEAGALRPVNDRTFAWDEVREAYRYLQTNRALGKVTVRVGAPAAAAAQ